MKLKIAFSPCPNDTFIFEALVHGRIDTEGLGFDYFLADIEELNRQGFSGDTEILKVSSHAYTFIAENYKILDSGNALGFGNGPLLISKKNLKGEDLSDALIAIPGKYTTANLLLSIAWPDAVNRKEYVFSEIENALLKDEVDAGLIIHETRFTYQKKGLRKIEDLGEYWDILTGLPIPLGLIAISRKIPPKTAETVSRLIRRSVEFALAHPEISFDFVSSNAREMDPDIMKNHIKLYVNEFSVQLGSQGKNAIRELFRIGFEKGIIPLPPEDIFVY